LVPKHRLRALSLPAAAAAAAGALALAAPAHAAYTGTVDAGTRTATLAGSGIIILSTKGGLVHHDTASGFESSEDFDSSKPGAQTVPDTGGWTVSVAGAGKDELVIGEEEPTNPISYAFGHTFFPGGVPCVVRDPNDRHGSISFSQHPAEETRFCYRSGFDEVVVKAGSGRTGFGVLDTEKGVGLRLFGSDGDDSLTEVADVPSSVQGEFHNPQSPVYFVGGPGSDQLTFDDGPATAPATYTIRDGGIRKKGLPPLDFNEADVESLALYPQDGPSKIVQGATGGAPLQVFGGFFGQKGPDVIDARQADAPLLATGSAGNDTIYGSVFPDYIDGGGGNDRIDSRDASVDQVLCNGGTGAVTADSLDRLTDCPTAKSSRPLVALRGAKLSPSKVKRGKRVTFSALSTVGGKVTLRFARGVTKRVAVKLGPNFSTLKLPRKLRKGRYRVSATLRGAKPVKLSLTVR
jgi:hypothetical protein